MPRPPHASPRPWSRRDFLGAAAGASCGLALGALGCGRARRPALLPRAEVTGAAAAAAAGAALDPSRLKPLLQELVHELERRVPYASALVLRQGATAMTIDDQTQSIEEQFASAGAVFTVFNGTWLEEVATADLTPEGLSAAARTLLAETRPRPGSLAIDPGGGGDRHFRTACRIDPQQIPLAERFERVRELRRRARATEARLVNAAVDLREIVHEEVFVNRAKAWSQEVIRVRGAVRLFAAGQGRVAADWLEHGGTGGLELTEFGGEELAALAAETLVLAEAPPLEPGVRRLVLDPSITGTIAHESFGHGVELDMFVKERALAARYLGKRVGSELVNILDDPSLPGGYGSYFFDHEGQAASPTWIVRNGVFERGLSDLMSASRLGVAPSANGRRQDFSRKAYARMSNTFFARGTGTPEELIAGVADGLYLRTLSHGMEDPKGWGIMVVAHVGEEIKDGRRTGRLFSPVGITGYVPEVLASVDGVAGDFATDTAGCGKGFKEFIAVSAGGPHIRLRARVS